MSDWHDKVDLSREEYTAYEFAYLDELTLKAAIATDREEGFQQGKALEIARRMLADGFSETLVMKYTKLSAEALAALKR